MAKEKNMAESKNTEIKYAARHLIPANLDQAKLSMLEQLRALKDFHSTNTSDRTFNEGFLFKKSPNKDDHYTA